MAPMVHGLEAKYAGKIKFVYLDIDDPANQAAKREFGFGYQPEFYLLDGDGNLLKKLAGFVPQEQFESVFAQYIQ
jgi:thioredoxin-like negative regulator of GroEL